MKRTSLIAALTLAMIAGAGAVSMPSQAAPVPTPSLNIIAAYSLVVPRSVSESGLVVRAVLPGGLGCPRMDVGVPAKSGVKQVKRPMQERKAATTTNNAFATLRVCEAKVPVRALTVSVAGRTVPAKMPRNIDSIAIFGDSGCRIKGSTIQACNDPAAWPLPRVVRSIVRDKTDIAIFLGDYFYREEACPQSANPLCGGSPGPLPGAPFTDSAWGWVADVLLPMGLLFQTRPLVALRGNHEECSRGGNGYYLMFDPSFGTAQNCAPSAAGVAPVVYSPTTAIDLSIAGGRSLRLVNVDSANGNDTAIDDTIAANQRLLFQQAATFAKGADEAWLMTHRPIAALVSTELLPVPPGEATPWSSVTQAYASYGLLGDFDLSLTSHIHLAQAIQVPGLPGELVLGNAGANLEVPTGYAIPPYGPLQTASGQSLIPPPLPPLPPIPTASSLETWVEFGYAVAKPTSDGWQIDLKDDEGVTFATCDAVDREIACK